jgi:hypothetical protein
VDVYLCAVVPQLSSYGALPVAQFLLESAQFLKAFFEERLLLSVAGDSQGAQAFQAFNGPHEQVAIASERLAHVQVAVVGSHQELRAGVTVFTEVPQ